MLKQSVIFPFFILSQYQGGGISVTKASSSLLPSISVPIIRSTRSCRNPTSINCISSRLRQIRGGSTSTSTSTSLLQEQNQNQNQNQTELDNQVIQNGAETIPNSAFVDGTEIDVGGADHNEDSKSIASQPENIQTSVPDHDAADPQYEYQHHVTPDDSVDIISSSKSRRSQPFNFIDHISISLALRLTCEINRRLAIGIDKDAYEDEDQYEAQGNANANSNGMEHDASHSIFYTNPSKRTPLSSYINNLFEALDKKQRHFETAAATDQAAISSMNLHIRAIALIYLERACSEQTVRQIDLGLVQEEHGHGHGGYRDTVAESPDVTCPHLNSTNVHKLFLAALILASRTYFNELPFPAVIGAPTSRMNMRDQITADYARMIQTSGDDAVRDLTAVDLANLLEWMAASLGAEGFVVHMEETNTFIDNWRHIFE